VFAVLIAWYLQQGRGWGEVFAGLFPFLLIFVIFYFLLFLPQKRRQQQLQQMLSNLKTGDRVVTTGGIRGTIVSVKDEYLHLKVPPQDIRLEVARSAIAGLVSEEEKKSA